METTQSRRVDASYKVLVLGETCVGKTALINCLVGREFRASMLPTIGVDFVKKTFDVDGARIQLAVWDTAGQERFRSITKMQYRGAQGIVLVYDVTNPSTFTHLSYWMNSINNEISHAHHSLEPVPIVLIGNKIDLKDRIKVSSSKGKKLADREMAFEFFETSAKTGENVQLLFERLAYHITDICNPQLMPQYYPNSNIPDQNLKTTDSPPFKLYQFEPAAATTSGVTHNTESTVDFEKSPVCAC
ncbi:ras-related protein Rab-3C-like [Argonauta hians]